MYITVHAKISAMHIEDRLIHVRVQWIMETQITLHPLNVCLQNVIATFGDCMEKEESQLHYAETKCIFTVHPIVLMQP